MSPTRIVTGTLVFLAGRQRPDDVPWTEVEQIALDRPPAMFSQIGPSR